MFADDLAGLPDEDRAALTAVVEHVAAIAPDATEGRSYGVAAFRYRGRPLLGFAAAKTHLSLFPFSPDVLAEVASLLDGFSLSKGTVRFTADHPVPAAALTALVTRRMAEIDGG